MLYLFCIFIARARMRIFGLFTAENIERGLDSDDEAADNLPCRAVRKRSFAALLCQAFFGKNTHTILKGHHAHGESPPGSAMAFYAFPAGLDPGNALTSYKQAQV